MYRLLFIGIALFYCSCNGSQKAIEDTQHYGVSEHSNKNHSAEVIPIKEVPHIVEVASPESFPDTTSKTHTILKKQDIITEAFDHSILDTLLQRHVSSKGVVNYKGFRKDLKLFTTYLEALEEIMPTERWSKEDTLAYWMNVYNAYTIKLILNYYPVSSIKDIKQPWDIRFFKLGSKWYNLNEIEHSILRKMGDPRIHFGINCASYSCPPLYNKAFTAANVDKALDQLTFNFVNDTRYNKISEYHMQLSEIFSWYAKDFKAQGGLIDFLNQYAHAKIHDSAKKSFLYYNWRLNE